MAASGTPLNHSEMPRRCPNRSRVDHNKVFVAHDACVFRHTLFTLCLFTMKLNAALFSTVMALLLASGAGAQTARAPGPKTGEQVYQSICFACHASGVAHAPKFGDRAAWTPLIAEGQAVLTGHAWVGVRAMPARGGSTDVSLEDFAKAVAYMARNAGGDWKDPDPAMMKKIASEANQRLGKSIKEQQAMQRYLQRWTQ